MPKSAVEFDAQNKPLALSVMLIKTPLLLRVTCDRPELWLSVAVIEKLMIWLLDTFPSESLCVKPVVDGAKSSMVIVKVTEELRLPAASVAFSVSVQLSSVPQLLKFAVLLTTQKTLDPADSRVVPLMVTVDTVPAPESVTVTEKFRLWVDVTLLLLSSVVKLVTAAAKSSTVMVKLTERF